MPTLETRSLHPPKDIPFWSSIVWQSPLTARLGLHPGPFRVFTIKIPGAAASAILEMEDALPKSSASALSAGRKVLSDKDTGLRITEQAPDDAVSLAVDDDPSKPKPDLLVKTSYGSLKAGQTGTEVCRGGSNAVRASA